MATTDTDVSQLVINKLTKQQYDAIATKSPTELYAVTDVPAVDVMTGATAGAAGTSGTVPAPAAGDNTKFLAGDGTWQTVSGGSSVTTLYANTPAPHSAIYSDQAKTTAVTTQEILDAFDNGTVYLVISPYEKYMLVNRYFDSVTNYAEFIFAGDRQTIRYSMQGLSSTMANGSTVNLQTDSSLDYSASEIDTGHTWVDGSKIYKKTINFGALPNSSAKTVAHNISNIANIIKAEGWAKATTGVMAILPFVSIVGLENGIQVVYNATDITVTAGTDRTNFTTCYITLYYTKSS